MDVGVYPYPHGDPLLIDKIVNEFLSQGKFDKLRKECMSDADTKPAYQNLQQRVENTVTQFLKKQVWRPDLNKNQLRDSLRKHILESKFFDAGISRIVDQVVNPNVLATVFLPEVEQVVYNYLSIPMPFDKNQRRGPSDDRVRPSGREHEHKTSQESHRFDKYGKDRSEAGGGHKRENHVGDEDYKSSDLLERKPFKDCEITNESIKTEPVEERGKTEDRIKLEAEEERQQSVQSLVEKMEIVSDESQESLSRMAVEGLQINESEGPPVPDSDDSVPLEINEKSMSESRDSEDSIMNQMSPISQGRLTPDLEDEPAPEEKQEVKVEEKPPEEDKKPLTFIGRIPKIKREDSDSSKSSRTKEDTPKKEKLDVKNVYSSDESDSSRSYGKSDSDEKRKRSEKSNKDERKREDSEKRQKDKKRDSSKDRKRERSRDRHKDHRRERSRERHKKSSSSSSSSQRERSSSHHKSSHRHKDSKSRRKEEEKKKSKGTDDHGKERNKKEDRRSTDRDSNERERGRSSGSRTEGESKKREKEQHKTEESRGEGNQREEAAVEKEDDVAPREEEPPQEGSVNPDNPGANDSDTRGLDFNELFQAGVLTKVEFPKLTDDFYVKFNSTGFKYFEDWEKAKLDCEEEFKEFVDEAENDLSLLSDDDTDPEFDGSFAEENRRTLENLTRGLGNFRRSLMFDPSTSEFYRWTNIKFYQKFRKKLEKRDRRNTDKNESDESIKENIDQGKRNAALHLKLINKYRRKAMRMGRSRRRQRRPESRGIKEKNENRGPFGKGFFGGAKDSEAFLPTRVTKLPERNLVQCGNTTVPVTSLSNIYENETVTLPESPEENEEWSDPQRAEKRRNGAPQATRDTKLSQNLPLNLPPSPDSDDINSGVASKNLTVSRKRLGQEEDRIPKKQTRRNYSQKYDSQDLYKPRPILNKSRTRGRERGLDRDIVSVGKRRGKLPPAQLTATSAPKSIFHSIPGSPASRERSNDITDRRQEVSLQFFSLFPNCTGN